MATNVNSKGLVHAKSLIAAGKVDKNSSWSFSAEDGNSMLGVDGKDWANYSSYHLAEDSGAAENTKERFKYPFGKDGKVYRSALTAIRQRAGQQDATDVFDAAGKLLESIDGKKDVSAKAIQTNDELLLICSGIDVSNLPDKIEVLVEGSHYFKRLPNGVEVEFTITANDIHSAIDQMTERLTRHPERDTVIDYEHQTLTGERAPAAGWQHGLELATRDGLNIALAKIKEWTKQGKEDLVNKYYRYASPVFALNAKDKETGKIWPCIYRHLALTNEPLLDDNAPIIAKQISQTNSGKDTPMKEVLKKLCSFLGIEETSDEQTITAKFVEFQANMKTAMAATADIVAKDVINRLSAEPKLVKEICAKDNGTIEEARVIFIAAKDAQVQLIAAKEEIATLKTAKFDTDFNVIIAKAFDAGKILPLQKNDAQFMAVQKEFAAKDMTAFAAYWEKQPKVAPIGKLPEAGDPDIAAKDITEEDVEMGKKLGVTKDLLAKYNPKK